MATDIGCSRYRSSGQELEQIPVTMTGHNPPLEDYTVVQLRQFFRSFDQIWDNVGSMKDYHECRHTSVRFSPTYFNSWSVYPWSQQHSNWTCRPFWIPWSPYLLIPRNVITWLNNDQYNTSSDYWEDFTANAYRSFTQQIPTRVSGYNLVQDIVTAKGLAKQVWRLLRKVQSILHKLGAYGLQHFSHLATLRELIKGVSNNYLLYQFGVKPIVSEAAGLLGSVDAILKRLNYLRKTQGSVIPVRYTQTYPFSKADRVLETADVVGMGDVQLWLRNAQGTVRYSATGKARNNLLGLEDFGSGVAALLAGFGAGDVTNFLWDLVPFSFAIDWCFNISAFLEKYTKINPFDGELEVIAAGTSFKKVCTGALYCEGAGLIGDPIFVGSLYFKEYERRAGLDVSLNLLSPLSGLTPHQLEVLTALVFQRV